MNFEELPLPDRRRINRALVCFDKARPNLEWLAENVFSLLSRHPDLVPLIHSTKWRVKDRTHLRHKLVRKTLKALEEDAPPSIPITEQNLLDEIEDLAGVHILHLHTTQFKRINKTIVDILAAQQWIVKGPEANTWDDEYRAYFRSVGVETISRESLYTSVHYIIRPNSGSPYKCELQVRTLAEEIWGEASHKIDYPDPTPSIACKEQLRALARVTSGCIRLVDSLFESEKEYTQLTRKVFRPR